MAAENSQLPLRGVILCCTSIGAEERTRIADIAAEMGAEHKYDLTSDVTHLLTGNIDTPKYKYVAKERPDVRVLTAEWIDAVREQWMAAEDVDVTALEDQHRAPPFFGLKICLTGFDDLDDREHISGTVKRFGAEYSGDLTREITHLIAAVPKGKKYEYARQWNVRVVSIEWVEDSVERGMALEEKLYDPSLSPEERGKGAWRKVPLEAVTGKRSRQEDGQAAAQGPSRRKLRRTVSEKFGSQTGAMWADITSGTSQQKENDEWDEQPEKSEVNARSVSKSRGNETSESDLVPAPAKDAQETSLQKTPKVGIFQGSLVAIYGFDTKKSSILRQHLTSNGAVAADLQALSAYSAEDQAAAFLIVPHDTPMESFPTTIDTPVQRVTEWWVEVCLHRKTLIDPSEEVLCRPFFGSRIDGFDDLVVCSTAFAPIDVVHLAKFVNLIGAKYDEYLKDGTSVLICDSDNPNEEKLTFAVHRGIPVVNPEWLWNSFKNGHVEPVEHYILAAVSDKTEGYKERPEIKRFSASEASEAKTQETVKVKTAEEPQRPKATPTFNASKPHKPSSLRSGAESALSQHVERDEDEDDAPVPVPSAGALQELAPQVNSPSRHSQFRSQNQRRQISAVDGACSFGADENTPPADVAGPEATESNQTAAPEPDNSENLHNAISVLLAQKQATRPLSTKDANAGPGISADVNQVRRRKRGLLGRASSATSNPSTSGAAGTASNPVSRTSSINSQQLLDNPGPATQALQEPPLPSQTLVFEDASVQREREEMIRRMGGKIVKSKVVSVEGVGVVRDTGGEEAGGVAARVRRRARDAKTGTGTGGDW